jgi:hypothetical protein
MGGGGGCRLKDMRRLVAAGAFALVMLSASTPAAVAPRPVVVTMDADRFEITGEGNAVTGLRRAPVPYVSLTDVSAAVRQPGPLPAAVRLVRGSPPQVIDYVWCVTEEGVLVVGRQVRSLDVPSGQYTFTEGDIKRAYPALEASVPWTWIVDIPLGREVSLTLEVRAITPRWPVVAVAVSPRVSP